MRGRGYRGHAANVVVDQVVQADKSLRRLGRDTRLVRELHQRSLAQGDDQLARLPVVELAGMGPERGHGRLGDGFVGREDHQLEKPLPFVFGQQSYAHVDRVPHTLMMRLDGMAVSDSIDSRILQLVEQATPGHLFSDQASTQRHGQWQAAALGNDVAPLPVAIVRAECRRPSRAS